MSSNPIASAIFIRQSPDYSGLCRFWGWVKNPINNFTIATSLPISDTNPIALELIGWRALIECPDVVKMLDDGSLQMTAPTLGASSKSTQRTRCEWKEPGYWLFSSAADHWNRQEMRLTKVNSLQKVVIGQIHVKGQSDLR